jgi:haloalkane dehalogenase
MEILRTPDTCFDNLADFPYQPHYCDLTDPDAGKLRLAYIDEGQGPAVLCMHGEPSWSYLYRKMIPTLVAAGYRVLAPDLIGFGRSDKPDDREFYTYQRHVDWIKDWIVQLDLQSVTLVAQDWGGLIGLRALAEMPERFARMSLGNTGLPTGDQPMGEAFLAWRTFSQQDPVFDCGLICNEFGKGVLTDAEEDAFRAPFPSDAHKAGARAFPMLVPSEPDDPASAANHKAWEVLGAWDKPLLLCFSDGDPITGAMRPIFEAMVPGAAGQPHVTLQGGHFVQNQDGERWAQTIVEWIAAGG